MSNTPRGAPELVASQALPESMVNEQIRRTEAGAARFPVASRVTAPPGTCADGASYIVIATATGVFTGKENQLATAAGTNAASGWYYRVLGAIDEGALAYVQDTDIEYKWSGAAWAAVSLSAITLDTDGTLAANSDTRVASQKATRTYVDAAVAAAGGQWKYPVRAATTVNGADATAFASGQIVDGVTLVTGDRILRKNQSAASENGLFTVNAAGAPTRAADADSGTELVNAAVLVSEGTANADKMFVCTTNAPITVGTTALTFANPFGGLGGGDLLAANNLSDLASAATARSNLGVRAAAPSIQAVASAATVTPTFADDQVNITAQAAALALANPTGTAVDGWGMTIRIKDNATARAISYGTQYRALGVTLPVTTVISKTLYLGMVFNAADTKWDVVAVAQEA